MSVSLCPPRASASFSVPLAFVYILLSVHISCASEFRPLEYFGLEGQVSSIECFPPCLVSFWLHLPGG